MVRVISAGALWFLALSVIIGQLIRLPLPGQPGGLLVSDIAVVAVLLVAFIQFLANQKVFSTHYSLPTTHYVPLTTPFILWSAFTILVHINDYAAQELLIAASYWLRTSAYLLLLPALIYLAREPKLNQILRRSFVAAILTLTTLGLLQWIFLPALANLPAALVTTSGGGWDPHEGRLVSTWLDPNFFGAYLALGLLYSLAGLVSTRPRNKKVFFGMLTLTIIIAGILTQSRSTTSALAATLLILSPLIIARLGTRATPALVPVSIAVASLGAIILLMAALALGDRALGLLTVDQTVQLRADALTAAWQVAAEHPFVGVGYNAWQFAARDNGLISDFSAHSRAGADNSFLTLFATTGCIGVILFMLPWLVSAQQLLQHWLLKGHAIAISALASLLFLTIHAQFINSWLYGHLLITIATVTALALTSTASHARP